MSSLLLVPELREMLAENRIEEMREFCAALHPANAAEFLGGLAPREIWNVLRNVDPLDRINIFRYFDKDLQRQLVQLAPQEEFDLLLTVLPKEEQEVLSPVVAKEQIETQTERSDTDRTSFKVFDRSAETKIEIDATGNQTADSSGIEDIGHTEVLKDKAVAARQPTTAELTEKIRLALLREYSILQKKCLEPVVTTSRRQVRSISEYLYEFLKWIVVSALIGSVSGVIGTSFQFVLRNANAYFYSNWHWLIFLLPFGGLAIVFFYRLASLPVTIGTNEVIDSLTSRNKPSLWLAPLIYFGSAVTHFLGGSAGREGAALQLGGCIGIGAGRFFRFDDDDRHIAILAGMSSCFAAIFGTPLTAVIFALEMAHVGLIFYPALVPCLFASLAAYKVSQLLGGVTLHFNTAVTSEVTLVCILQTVGLAVLCALVCIFFCVSMRRTGVFFRKYIKNDYFRVLLGGAIVIGLTFFIGNVDYNGVGSRGITEALAGRSAYDTFFWKILFTAVTLGVGYKGGEIVPAMYVGASFGCVVGGLLGLDPALAASLGLVGVFCGTVNCPLTSLVLSIELFGTNNLWLFAIVCGTTYTLSGYYSLYGSQRIIYSKIKADLIDIQAK